MGACYIKNQQLLKTGGFNKRNPEAKIMTVDNLFIFLGKL